MRITYDKKKVQVTNKNLWKVHGSEILFFKCSHAPVSRIRREARKKSSRATKKQQTIFESLWSGLNLIYVRIVFRSQVFFFWAIKGATLFVENIFVLITGNLELKCSTGDKVNAFFVVVGTFISTDRTVYY